MRSCLIEIRGVRMEHTLELPLLNKQQMVEAFLPHTAQEAFADGVGSWCMNRRLEQLDATGPRHTSEAGPKFGIVITNELFRCLSIGGRFSQLLGHPGIGRRACHAHVDHFARVQEGVEEREERSKEQIRHLQEVAGPDLSGVVTQKGRPLLTAWL